MALNFSHRPIFPPQLPEENLVQGGSQDKDIHELLPVDPFGMDISSTVTALTEWLEDLGADYGSYRGANIGVCGKDYPFLTNWNFWWDTTTALDFQTFPGYQQFHYRKTRDACVSGTFYSPEKELGCSDYDYRGFQFSCNLDAATFDPYNAKGSLDRFVDHENHPWDFNFYPLKEELDFCPLYNGGVPFASIMEGSSLGLAYAGFDDNGNGMTVDALNNGKYNGNDGENVVNDNGNHEKNVEGLFSNHGKNDGHDNGNHEKNMEVLDGDGIPHTAMKYALPYLGVRDLLSIEMVCKSLRQIVRTELLFTYIDIRQPLSDRLTDDILLELTKKACGELHCLCLVECQRITDDGLRRILDANPKLVKLSVAGCTRLSIDGILKSVRAFQTVAIIGIKYLRVGGIFGVTETHFKELVSLLGIGNNHIRVNHYKPHFFFSGKAYLSFEDDRPIDIEICPRCQNLRLVYDCPAESCQSKDDDTQLCRACTHCIPRCSGCGKCINDDVYTETFLFEAECLKCAPSTKRSQCTNDDDRDISHEEAAISFHG
ncbi:F-box protein SKIP14 [Bienertia sinuspersici]